MNIKSKEKTAPNQHLLIKAIEGDETIISFFINTVSTAESIIAQIRNCSSGFLSNAYVNLSGVVSNTK